MKLSDSFLSLLQILVPSLVRTLRQCHTCVPVGGITECWDEQFVHDLCCLAVHSRSLDAMY